MLWFKKIFVLAISNYGKLSFLTAQDANHYSYMMWNKHKKENAKYIINIMFDT